MYLILYIHVEVLEIDLGSLKYLLIVPLVYRKRPKYLRPAAGCKLLFLLSDTAGTRAICVEGKKQKCMKTKAIQYKISYKYLFLRALRPFVVGKPDNKAKKNLIF